MSLREAVLVERDDYVPPRVRLRDSEGNLDGLVLPLDRFRVPGNIDDGDVLLVRLVREDGVAVRASFVGGPLMDDGLTVPELFSLLDVGGMLWGSVVALALQRGGLPEGSTAEDVREAVAAHADGLKIDRGAWEWRLNW